jgi:tetratricopeptide (TPR) repeat protein
MRTRAVRRALAACIALSPVTVAAQSATAGGSADGARLFAAGNYAEAKAIFEPAFKADRSNANAAYYLGRIAMEEDRFDRASDFFEVATKLDSSKSDYFLWLGRAYGSEAEHANVLRQPGLARKCKGAWEHAIQLDPNNLDARADLIQYYVRAPGIMGGSTEKAFTQAEEIRKRDAVRGNLELAQLYEREKKPAEAEKAYVAAAGAAPADKPNATIRLGMFYVNRGQYDKAFDLFEVLVKSRPDDPVPLFLVGRTASVAKQRLDRGQEALEAYLKATAGTSAPNIPAAHYRLGTIFEQKNDRAKARTEYQEAVRLDPKLKAAAEALQKLPPQ